MITKEDLSKYMNAISDDIAEAESKLEHIWFDVEVGPISWKENQAQGKRRIMFMERPLYEAKFLFREKHYHDVKRLVELAYSEAEKRMDSIGNSR